MKGYEKYKEVGLPWLKVIPEEWKLKPIREIFYERKEINSNSQENNVLSVMKGVGVIPYEDKGNVGNKASEDISKYKIVKVDDIVLNSMNVIIGSVGKSKYNGVLSQVYYVLVNRNNNITNIEYLHYCFKVEEFYKHLKIYGRGILEHRLKIPMYSLGIVQLPLPSLPEQEQIANFLDWKIGEIDRLIELEQKKINEIKSLKTKIIDKYMFIESDYSVKLKFLGKFVKGRGIARENLSDLGKYPVILYGDIYTKYNFSFSEVINKVDFDVFDNAIKIHENTLLFPTSGETKEDIGKTVLYEGKKSVAIGGDVLSFTISNEEINANYLMYYLNSSESLAYKYVNGRGDIIVHISEHSLNKIVVNFPSMDKQIYIADKISQKFDEIEMLLNNTIKQISYLEELKQTLISDAVTGKIDVRDIKIPQNIHGKEEG